MKQRTTPGLSSVEMRKRKVPSLRRISWLVLTSTICSCTVFVWLTYLHRTMIESISGFVIAVLTKHDEAHKDDEKPYQIPTFSCLIYWLFSYSSMRGYIFSPFLLRCRQKDFLEDSRGFKHRLHAQFLTQDAFTLMILLYRLTPASLGGIDLYKLLVGRFVTGVLFENGHSPFRSVLIAFDCQIVLHKHPGHSKVRLTQLLPLKDRPIVIDILR